MDIFTFDLQRQKASKFASKSMLVYQNCQYCIVKVGWIGIWLSLLLAIIQGAVGIVSSSNACLAIALQSVYSIVSSCSIIFTQKINTKLATDNFPYGYGKIEFIIFSFVSILFNVIAISLIIVTIKKFMEFGTNIPDFIPILVTIVSIIANELLFRYMYCVAIHTDNQTIMSNAWINRFNVYTLMIVAICTLGVWLGMSWLDTLATVIISLLIIKTVYSLFIESIQGLLDCSMNDQYRERVETIAVEVDGVYGIHRVWSRQIGYRKIYVELEIEVDANNTIRTGQCIANNIRDQLLTQIKELDQALIYFKPVLFKSVRDKEVAVII